MGLAPLGNYGGPTQTIALLPGSPAIGAGVIADYPGTTIPMTTDQRGEPLASPKPDIGAFQSQGFTLTPVAGSTPQSAETGTAFAKPLAVTVTPNDANDPVNGGVITFTAPTSGASANLSAGSATIAGGSASIGATANATAGGPYTVTAAAAGAATVSFSLSNSAVGSTLTSVGSSVNPSTYGQSVTFTATVDNTSGSGGTPTGSVEFFDGTTALGAGTPLSANGTSATSTFRITTLPAGTDSISAVYTPTGVFAGSTGTLSQTVNKAVLTISAVTNIKPYDGTSSAAATPTYQVANEPANTLYGSDTLTNLTETYNNPNVGTGKTLAVATYTISDPANYAVTLVANNTGVITATSASAALLGTNTTTEGSWIGTYGSQGYDIIENAVSLPSYATVTPSGQSSSTGWPSSTTDPRALQTPSGTSRIAACWYSATSFTVDVNLTDGQTHDLVLYFLDWDQEGRSEQVQLTNATTGTVLDTETVSSFSSGVYLQWAVRGNVLFTFTRLTGKNAVLSGLFFDPVTPSASLIKTDTTTEGNWIGAYGSQGYDIIENAVSLPSYATVTPAGQSSSTGWPSSTTAPQALQTANGSSRIAACWYSATSFTVDVNLTDGQTHDLALYFLDWDQEGWSEQVQLTNAATGTVLDTETVSSFSSGVYLQWAVRGNVLITFTRLAGKNAVLSGLFLDPASTSGSDDAYRLGAGSSINMGSPSSPSLAGPAIARGSVGGLTIVPAASPVNAVLGALPEDDGYATATAVGSWVHDLAIEQVSILMDTQTTQPNGRRGAFTFKSSQAVLPPYSLQSTIPAMRRISHNQRQLNDLQKNRDQLVL